LWLWISAVPNFLRLIIINIIYYQILITNKWACNILNWNHSFIWKEKTEGILQKAAACSKSGNKTHLQSPVSRIVLERWKRRKTQELQRGAVTQPHIYSLEYIIYIIFYGNLHFSSPDFTKMLHLKNTRLLFL